MWLCKKSRDIIITAPINGQSISLDHVNDEVFRKRMIGDGIAFIPTSDTVMAPITGKINMVAESGHAYGITDKNGLEILIHIGIDTVTLKGNGFRSYVTINQPIERGQVIAQFDKVKLEKDQFDITIILIFPNANLFHLIDMKDNIDVIAGETEIVKFKKI